MKRDSSLALGLLSVIALGCSTVTALLTPMATPPPVRPADFSLHYLWREGSLPPPYHYEYDIRLDGNGEGVVTMIPDYPSSGALEWQESFTVSAQDFDQFYALCVAQGLFTEEWQGLASPPIGGSSDNMTITADGRQIEIPSYVIESQSVQAAAIYDALRVLVPQEVWTKLEGQRQQYIEQQQSP